MKYVILFIVLFLPILLLTKGMDKLWGKEQIKISDTHGAKHQATGYFIIIMLLLLFLFMSFYVEIDINITLFVIILWTVISGFQAFLEWKYIKQTKQYLKTIITLFYMIFVFVTINYFI